MADENVPPSLRAELAELDHRLYELERRLNPTGAGGDVIGTDFVCVNMGPWPFDVPDGSLKLGSVQAGPTQGPVDQNGCAPGSRTVDAVTFNPTAGATGWLPVWGTAG